MDHHIIWQGDTVYGAVIVSCDPEKAHIIHYNLYNPEGFPVGGEVEIATGSYAHSQEFFSRILKHIFHQIESMLIIHATKQRNSQQATLQ